MRTAVHAVYYKVYFFQRFQFDRGSSLTARGLTVLLVCAATGREAAPSWRPRKNPHLRLGSPALHPPFHVRSSALHSREGSVWGTWWLSLKAETVYGLLVTPPQLQAQDRPYSNQLGSPKHHSVNTSLHVMSWPTLSCSLWSTYKF